MNKFVLSVCLLLMLCCANLYGQRALKIGDTKYVLQSPIRGSSIDNNLDKENDAKKYRYSKHIEEVFMGVNFVCPLNSNENLDVSYSNSYGLELGWRSFYRPIRPLAFGVEARYSFYNYRLNNNGEDIFNLGIGDAVNGNNYFRTDNLGTALIMRIYIARNISIDCSGWGDFVYSKRLVVKDYSSGSKEKFKYRDETKFNPFVAGVQASLNLGCVNLYTKYRLTNSFNNNKVSVLETPRLSIGLQLVAGW